MTKSRFPIGKIVPVFEWLEAAVKVPGLPGKRRASGATIYDWRARAATWPARNILIRRRPENAAPDPLLGTVERAQS